MCTTFTCPSCKLTFYNHCKNVDSEPSPASAQCPDLTLLAERTKCITCTTIRAVIAKLETLVFRLPFLETHGAIGVKLLSQWEREDAEKILYKTKGIDVDGASWVNRVESREERHKLAAKVTNMGLGWMQDAREQHQGFAMALTPEEE